MKTMRMSMMIIYNVDVSCIYSDDGDIKDDADDDDDLEANGWHSGVM